jgi:hypothetical protein
MSIFEATDIKTRLLTLWIVVMVNMIFADIFFTMVELVQKKYAGYSERSANDNGNSRRRYEFADFDDIFFRVF